MNPRVVTQRLGGNRLAAALIEGSAPAAWYQTPPRDASAWRERLESVRASSDDDWLTRLAAAFEASGKAKQRLEAASAGRGVVVTTGQQPGLFGGPIYTLSKALSALAHVLRERKAILQVLRDRHSEVAYRRALDAILKAVGEVEAAWDEEIRKA